MTLARRTPAAERGSLLGGLTGLSIAVTGALGPDAAGATGITFTDIAGGGGAGIEYRGTPSDRFAVIERRRSAQRAWLAVRGGG